MRAGRFNTLELDECVPYKYKFLDAALNGNINLGLAAFPVYQLRHSVFCKAEAGRRALDRRIHDGHSAGEQNDSVHTGHGCDQAVAVGNVADDKLRLALQRIRGWAYLAHHPARGKLGPRRQQRQRQAPGSTCRNVQRTISRQSGISETI
jgi:hypothetical protein